MPIGRRRIASRPRRSGRTPSSRRRWRRCSAGTQTWTVRNVDAAKIKSSHGRIAVLGRQTEKIVDLFRTQWRHEGLLFKFKLEVGISPEELIRAGQVSRKASGADYLLANTLEMVEGE